MGHKRRQGPARLGPGMVDHPGGKIGAPATQRPARGIGGDHLVSCARQDVECGTGDVGFHPSVERVGKQKNLALGARRARFTHLAVAEEVAAEHGQAALPREAEGLFPERGQQGHLVAQRNQAAQRCGDARITGHLGDQAFAQAIAHLLPALIQHLGFHLGHVHARRAFALARLAANAKFHSLGHLVRVERVFPKAARQGKAQGVGPPARDIAFVAGHAITGAHGAALEFAAGAVVVAHLDRALKPAAPARPVRPVVPGFQVGKAVVRGIAHQAAVIHLRSVNDLARIEARVGVEGRLDLFECAENAVAEHLAVKLRPDDPVAMLAGMRPLVFAHHLERGLGDLAHGAHVLVELEVQNGPYVQTSFRGMGIPRAFGSVLVEHLGQAVGVVGQVFKRDGAILDEGHGLAFVLHRHHDVQPGLAQFTDLGGEGHVPDFDNTAFPGAALTEAIAKVRHRILKPAHVLFVFRLAVGEFHEQHRRRAAAHEFLQRAGVERNGTREPDHRIVDQFDRGGAKRDKRGRSLHRGAEGREMADAQNPGLGRER